MIDRIVLFSIPIQELKEIIAEVLEEKLKGMLPITMPPTPPTKEYLTRKEVCEMLHISLSTLFYYSKDGRLSRYRIGGRILYRAEEVRNAVINKGVHVSTSSKRSF
jgi:excisionase family DNA binding protein